MKRIASILGGLLVVGLFLSIMATAMADDLIPAPWRGADNTTLQETTFGQSWLVDWETVDNPFGDPDIWMYADAWQWDAQAQGRQGVISWGDFENGFSIDLPNNEDPDLLKRIWVQVTYYGAAPDIWEAFGMMQGGGSWTGVPALQGSFNHGDGWITEAREMIIRPNPPSEFVGVRWSGVGMVDQIIVETICVPEPGTWALLSLGAAGLLLFLHRRKSTRKIE